jgi:hypothetical protein
MENTIIKKLSFKKAESDSNEFYHSQPGISASGLKLIKKSPAHFKESQEAPKTQTDAMAFGEMYHTFILENERFYENYTIVDPEQRPDQDHSMTAKKNAAWLDSFENPVMKETFDQLKDMRRVLFSHPYAKALLKAGEVERSYYCELDIGAKDPISVRFRPDNVRHDKRVIVDLKTAADASADGFKKAAANFDYQIQAALYADLMELVMNEPLGYDFFSSPRKGAPVCL